MLSGWDESGAMLTPGGWYHVHTRGNNKARLYFDALDNNVFLQLAERSRDKYESVIVEWCLMTNHFHLVLRVSKNGLAKGVSELNGSFARWSNAATDAATISLAAATRATRSRPTRTFSKLVVTSC
jgi:REP element-mobilizing transposase RayT